MGSSFRSAHKLTLIAAMFLSLASAASVHDESGVCRKSDMREFDFGRYQNKQTALEKKLRYKGSDTTAHNVVNEDGTKTYFGPTPPTKEERAPAQRKQDEIRAKAIALRREKKRECKRVGGWFCNQTKKCRTNTEVGIFNQRGHVCKTCYRSDSRWEERAKSTKAERDLLDKVKESARSRAAEDNRRNRAKVDGIGCLPGKQSFSFKKKDRLMFFRQRLNALKGDDRENFRSRCGDELRKLEQLEREGKLNL